MKKLLLFSLCFLMLSVTQIYAQGRTISGTVTAKEDGLPVPGVTVKIQGSQTATVTGTDGRYTIKNVSENSVLVFSFIGYTTQSVPVGSHDKLNVILEPNAKQLNEVVVTALGFRADKDRLATSQSSISNTDIEQSGEVSTLNALASKASGVQVVRSGGDPGAGTYIQIRGQSTIANDIQPLIIVDGIPVSNSTLGSGVDGTVQQSRLSDINPDDIASTTVLKGAAAAALYGTRAANGVILITTKKGKDTKGKINISLDNTYSIDVLNKSVPLQTTFGQGSNGLYGYGNRLAWGDMISSRAGGADVNSGSAYVILPDGSRRYAVASGTAANPHGGKNSKEIFDHSKDLFHNGFYLDNTLTLSGGDDKTVYYVSAENLDQKGILKAGSDYYRKAFKSNVERKFGDVLKLSTNVGYSNVWSNRVQQGSNVSGIFLGGLRTPADFDNSIYQGTYVDPTGALFPNREIAYRNPIGASTNSIYDNPFYIINNITSTSKVNRAFGTFEATINANKWLSFVERAGVDYYSDDRIDNFPKFTAAQPTGQLTVQELSEMQFNNDFIARATKQFSNDFGFNGLLGFNYNNRRYENVGATVKNFTLPGAPFDLNNSAGDSRFPFNTRQLIRTTATYAQLSFNAYDQLFLDLTGRAEQASTFANTFFFPSAAFAWQFTKLPVFKENKVLSFGKLRLTYGEVGVQPSPYLSSTYFVPASLTESYGSTINASSPVYGGGYIQSTNKGNPNIKPERKKEGEVGLDLRFLSDRISLSGTYYSNKTTGAIFGVSVPATTGFVTQQANAASLSNKGFEADLGVNWYRSQNGDLSITTSANFSKNKNKVLSLSGTNQYGLAGFTAVVSSAVPGYPLGVFWGPGIAKDANGKAILDANGFPTAASESSVLGDPNPNWTGGVTNTFRYKRFNLSFLIDHVQGGQVWNGTRAALATIGTAAFTGNMVTAPTNLKDYNGNIIPAGTTFRGNIANYGGGDVALTQPWYSGLGGGFGSATVPEYFESGTRTRLRDITLGYSITGEKFKQKTKLQSIDIAVSGRNIALWTKYTGIDPETNLTGPSNGRGIDYFNNPSTRSYFFTLKINY